MPAGTQIASMYAKVGADVGQFDRKMKDVRQELDKTQKSAASLQKAVGTGLKIAAGIGIAAIGALAAGIGNTTRAAADMEQQIANIAAVMNLTAEETAKVNDLITDLGLDPKLKVSAVEAGEAIEMLAKNGLTLTDIMNGAARSTILLANSTGGDFAQAADIATDVMAQFNISASQMDEAVNGIAGVTKSSKFDINDYTLAIGQAGGVASSVGVSFDDFNATIAAISPLFASGSDAGTSFKVFLQRLEPDTAPAKTAMRELGLLTEEAGNAFFTATGQMKTMPEIAGILANATKGLSEQQKINAYSTIFGTDAIRAAFGVADAGTNTFQELKNTIGNTSAEDAAATRMDTLAGAIEILDGVYETLRIQIGQQFLPVVRRVVEWATELASVAGPPVIAWAGKLADKMTVLMDSAQVLIEPIQIIIERLGQFIVAVRTILKPIKSAIGNYLDWQDSLTALAFVITAMLIPAVLAILGPATIIMAKFAALTAAVMAVRIAWNSDFLSIRTRTKKVINDLTNWFIRDSGIWRGTFEDTLKYLEYWATFGWKYSLVYPVIQWLKNIRDEIKWKARDWKDALLEWIHDTKNLLRDWGIAVTEDMKRKLQYALIEIERWIKKVEINFNRWKMMNLGVFEDWGREVKEKIAGWLDKIGVLDWINKGRDIVQGLWDGFTEKWNRFTSWTGATWTSWVNRFKSFFGIRSPSTLFYGFGANIVEGLSGGINDTAFKAVQAIDSLGNKLDVAFKAVSSDLDEAFKPVINSLDKAFRGIGNGLDEAFKPVVKNMANGLDEAFKGVGNGLDEEFKAIFDNAKAQFVKFNELNLGGWKPSDGKGPPIVYEGDKTTITKEMYEKWAKQVRDTAYDGMRFGTALSKAAFNLPGITSSPDEVLSMLAQFAKSAKSAFTNAGIGVTLDDGSMVPISTNARNAMARLGDRDATMGNSTEMVVAAVQALIAELRNKGVGNQFNLEVAPSGATGDEGLLTLVQYLQALTQ